MLVAGVAFCDHRVVVKINRGNQTETLTVCLAGYLINLLSSSLYIKYIFSKMIFQAGSVIFKLKNVISSHTLIPFSTISAM